MWVEELIAFPDCEAVKEECVPLFFHHSGLNLRPVCVVKFQYSCVKLLQTCLYCCVVVPDDTILSLAEEKKSQQITAQECFILKSELVAGLY